SRASPPPPPLPSFPTRRSSDLILSCANHTTHRYNCQNNRNCSTRPEVHEAPRKTKLDKVVAHSRRASTESKYSHSPDEPSIWIRSEEHTSELQSPYDLVCRLLL